MALLEQLSELAISLLLLPSMISYNNLLEVITGAFDGMYTMIMPFKDRAVSA